MFRRPVLEQKLNQAIRLSLYSAAAASTLLSTAAVAQQTEAAVERVQVTGSRIMREGAISPSPVTSISGAELLETGALNIGEALNELPALASTYSLANSGSSIGAAGLSLLDLRGMGTSRTLVLIDGKRHVASSAGTASVDTNTIPTAWVESVEIITGGASAIYGADAVTGVVNFKLKKNIQGLDVSATASKANDNPYNNQKLTFSYGQDIANGDGNVAFAADFATQDGMNANDRSLTRTPWFAVTNPANKETQKDAAGNTIHDGVPDKITLPNAGYFDSSVNGNFLLNKVWYTFNPDGSVRPQEMGTVFASDYACQNCEILNLRDYDDLQPNFDRYSFNLKGDYDLTSEMNLSASAKHVVNEGYTVRQPSFFEYGSALVIQRDNAFVSPSLAALMDTNNRKTINVHRFNKDAGRRKEENTRITDQFNLNLKGQLNDDWSIDSFVTHGQTTLKQKNFNNLIRKNWAQSIDAVNLNGQIVCRDAAARAAGCVPTSVFGNGAVSEAAANWFNTTAFSESKIKQRVIGTSFANSNLYDLPAGGIGFAGGVEYRHEQSDNVPDPFSATGATFLNALQPTHGKFHVKEVFAEITVPLLSDVGVFQDLTFDAAARYADYSTIGEATSWKTGLDWTFTDELRIRSTYSVALRAPNISELYRPLNQTFFRVSDPCDIRNKQSANRVTNCAKLGVPAQFVSTATGSSIEGLSGGNRNLKAEESDSYTVGFVYQPEWVENVTLTVDYWSIDIEDAIDNVTAQNVVNKCVDSAEGINNVFCQQIVRDPVSKELELITSSTLNVAAQTAEGVDFELGYDFDAAGGRFKTKLFGTYLDSRKVFSFQNNPAEFEQRAGTEGEATWQENYSIAYSRDAWTASWKTRHLSGVSLYTDQQLAINPDASDIMNYGSYFISDISLGYEFSNGVKLTVGIDNLFDRNLPGVTTGTGAYSASYDNIGQLFYSTVSFKM